MTTYPDVHRVLIYGDNKPSLALTSDPDHHSRTKHVNVPYHYVQEEVELESIQVEYLPTNQMPVDGLTKPLITIAFDQFVMMLG
jgi:hypothetical protein